MIDWSPGPPGGRRYRAPDWRRWNGRLQRRQRDLYGAFPVKRLFWVVLTVFCSERGKAVFRPVACNQGGRPPTRCSASRPPLPPSRELGAEANPSAKVGNIGSPSTPLNLIWTALVIGGVLFTSSLMRG
jgi:hypothetical protein